MFTVIFSLLLQLKEEFYALLFCMCLLFPTLSTAKPAYQLCDNRNTSNLYFLFNNMVDLLICVSRNYQPLFRVLKLLKVVDL